MNNLNNINMDRQWIMVETYQNILKAVNVYKCKRNVDANLMDEKVAKNQKLLCKHQENNTLKQL